METRRYRWNGKFWALVILLAVIFIALFSSCMTNRKGELTEKGKNFIALHCKGSDSTETKEVIKYKDTAIYITTAGPIQYLPNPCKELCDSLGNLKPFEKKEKKNGIKSTIKTTGNVLAFECEADSLKAVITTLQKERSIKSKERIVIQKPCDLEHRTKFDGFTWWWFWITSAILTIYLFVKYVIKAIRAYFCI